jgi:hypothetical protein
VSSFVAARPKVTVGDGTTLTAVFSGGSGSVDHGIGPVLSGVPISTGRVDSDRTFTLTVENSVGTTATASATVTVSDAPVIESFTPAAATVTACNGTTVTAVFSGGDGTVDPLGAASSGVAMDTGPLLATTTYRLAVTNAAGDTTRASATVTVVDPAVATSLVPGASIITVGGATTLTPAFSGGVGVIRNDQDGAAWPVSTGQGVPIAPGATATYTLRVTNAAGAESTCVTTVSVVPPPVITSFAVPPFATIGHGLYVTPVFSGGTARLVGANPPTAGFPSGSDVAVDTEFAPTTVTYTLVVENAAGSSVQAPATVEWQRPPTITAFSAYPATLAAGGGWVNLVGTWTADRRWVAFIALADGSRVPDLVYSPDGCYTSVLVSRTTAFTLVLTNAAGTTTSSTVVVTVP